jgi:cystathionine beta-lyase/cystathionine gamma-synthase
MTRALSSETLCAQGAPADASDSALVPPIVYSATFAARDAAEFAAMASRPRHSRYYTRYGNPLHEQVAAQLGHRLRHGRGVAGAARAAEGR